MILPNLSGWTAHAGDSRVYHFRGSELVRRTIDHSYVQRLIDEGKITEAQANTHPQSNLLTGCLGTQADPPMEITEIERLEVGDTLLACSDGLWHYLSPQEPGCHRQRAQPARGQRDACLISKEPAMRRARATTCRWR